MNEPVSRGRAQSACEGTPYVGGPYLTVLSSSSWAYHSDCSLRPWVSMTSDGSQRISLERGPGVVGAEEVVQVVPGVGLWLVGRR